MSISNPAIKNKMTKGTIVAIGTEIRGIPLKLWTRANFNEPWVLAPDNGEQMRRIAIMKDGTLLGSDFKYKLYTRENLNESWVKVPDHSEDQTNSISELTIMQDGSILGISGRQLFTKENLNSPWLSYKTNGSLFGVTIMQDGTILGINTDRRLVPRNILSESWGEVIDKHRDIYGVSIMPDGTILGVPLFSNKLMTRDNLKSEWIDIDPTVVQVTIMRDGSLLGIDKDGKLYTRANLNSPWKDVLYEQKRVMTQVSVMKNGDILGIDNLGSLFYRADLTTPWKPGLVDGNALGVTIMQDGSILGVGTNGSLFIRKDPNVGWGPIHLNDGSVWGVAIMKNGLILGINNDYQLLTRPDLNTKWGKPYNQIRKVAKICIMHDGTILGIEYESNRLMSRANLASPWVDDPFYKVGTIYDIACVKKSPYLIVQTRLMQDYHHSEGVAPNEITNHRVVITTHDKDGNVFPDRKLKLYLHEVDLSPTMPNLKIQVIDGDGIRKVTPTFNEPIEMTTSVLGQVSFGVDATKSLISPVFRVHADFMPDDNHGLLIFPDRHCMHLLANMNENALSGNWGTDPSRKRNPISNDNNDEKSVHIVKAINKLMGNAVDKTIDGKNPTVRKPSEILLSDVLSSNTHDHENIAVTKTFYDPINDITASHSIKGIDPIIRTTNLNESTAWFIGKEANGSGQFGFKDNYDITQTINQMAAPSGDPLSLALWNAHHKGIAITSDALKQKVNTRSRNITDIVGEIERSEQILVHTLETKLNDTGQRIKTTVMVIFNTSSEPTVVALHSLVNVALAIEGLLKKVGISIEDFIFKMRDLFHWEDIKNTHNHMYAHLKAVIPFLTQTLPKINDKLIKKVDGFRTDVIKKIESYEPKTEHAKILSSDSNTKYQAPLNIRSSYGTHLFAANVSDVKINMNETKDIIGAGKIDQLIKLFNENLNPSDKVTFTNILTSLPGRFKAGLSEDLRMVIFKLLEELKSLINLAFYLTESIVTLIFTGIEDVLNYVEAQLSTEIKIPFVTYFYEQVLDINTKMDMYSLVSLLAAVPSTVIGKIVRNSNESPFPPFDPNKPVELKEYYDDYENASKKRSINKGVVDSSLIFGAIFGTTIVVHTVISTLERKWHLKNYLVVNPLQKIISAEYLLLRMCSSWILQFSQIPIGSWSTLIDNRAKNFLYQAQEIEVAIWWLQFLPISIESIIHGTVAHKGANNSETSQFNASGLPTSDVIISAVWSIFGTTHFAYFITQLKVEIDEAHANAPATNKPADIKGISIKGAGNIISTIPEIMAFPNYMFTTNPEPETRAILSIVGIIIDAVSNGSWDIISFTRWASDVQNRTPFSDT